MEAIRMANTIINTDPIKINLPESLYQSLLSDAASFEVLKRDGERINLNGFMSSFVSGYYEKYLEEVSRRARRIREMLSPFITDQTQLDRATLELVEDDKSIDGASSKDANSKSLKFRPTKETDGIIIEIEEERRTANESLSGFFRKMLYSYSKKPTYERERIIYHGITDLLERACSSKKEITFTYRDKPGLLHRVVPYRIRYGTDELHNYLLCQEYNEFRDEMVAMSYRLCRIVNPRITKVDGQLDSRTTERLVKMEKYGPQYTINEETETCVEFTPDGRKSFQRLYQGRPIVDRKEPEDDSGNVKYYFTCSQDQLYLYLRRFNPGETTILYPEGLKARLYQFHLLHLINLEPEDGVASKSSTLDSD